MAVTVDIGALAKRVAKLKKPGPKNQESTYVNARNAAYNEALIDVISLLGEVETEATGSGGHCEAGGHCVCGGDLPRVREGCGNWVKAT